MTGNRSFRNWIWASDSVWLVISMVLAWCLRYGPVLYRQSRSTIQPLAITLLGALLIWSVLWSVVELDGFRGEWRLAAVSSQLLMAASFVMATLLAAEYLLRVYVSRLALGYFGVLMLGGVILIRVAARCILCTKYRSGDLRRIVIVGNGPVAREAMAKIEQHPEMLCKVVGLLATSDASRDSLPTIPAAYVTSVGTCSIVELLQRHQVDELIFAMSRNGNAQVGELMDQCVKRGISVSVIPQPYELYLSAPELVDLDGLPILRLRHSLLLAADPAWKRVLDLVLAIPLLLAALPVIFVGACLLKVKKGEGISREERYGIHGQKFFLYRLNSPRKAKNLPIYELVMRHLSITELPQLFNVLRGEMSLVGPRPEGFESVRHYTDWHRQRLNVKPGMTGLAQVHGLREQNPIEDKTRYDLQYILRCSLFQDLSLLIQTLWTIGGRVTHLGNLNRPDQDASQPRPEPHSLAIGNH